MSRTEKDLPLFVAHIAEVRTEYTSARLILENLTSRIDSGCRRGPTDRLPPEIDYETSDGASFTIQVRDYDVRYLDRVAESMALAHLNLIHLARRGDGEARRRLEAITRGLHPKLASRFKGAGLVEDDYVIPYTTERRYTELQVSDKGSVLLELFRRGFATADFNLLAAAAYLLPEEERRAKVRDAVSNLERLSGRVLGDPDDPLLIAMRSAMPRYLPGFMPTYLNVGLTPRVLLGLPRRYGADAASRIRLCNRKTILEALDPKAFAPLEDLARPGLTREENDALSERLEAMIARRDPSLLEDPYRQVDFFLDRTYRYYDDNLDVLRNFMGKETHYPTIILQRMVCSVIDDQSYAGVLYSRHPRFGTGIHLQYARAVYGEDLMTGRLSPQEVHLTDSDRARREFPAVYHFSRRISGLERIFAAPVMVEFTGVHGTFTILQVNKAELSGVGMLTAVMDLHRAGEIDAKRVRELIEPFHIRQIESDDIDPSSFRTLGRFCRGISVLPRSAVTGRLYFDGEAARVARKRHVNENVILARQRFTPTDTITMQEVDGICSLSPAAIHVVTAAQTLGIPTLLDLEKDGVRLDEERRRLVDKEGAILREGDWVTISSRKKTLFTGKAVFAPARLLRFIDGEEVELRQDERALFERMSAYYREYRMILEGVDAEEFTSLQDLGHAIRRGNLERDLESTSRFVDLCFDLNGDKLVNRLFDTTLGMHANNLCAFDRLCVDRRAKLLAVAVRRARAEGRRGYQAGSFVIGCLVRPESEGAFWRALSPSEIAFLLNEWVLHQKYQELLSTVGERRLNRAREMLLFTGLERLHLHPGRVKAFMPLKLCGHDLTEIAAAVEQGSDPQTAEVLALLALPYGEFYDFDDPRGLAGLESLCAKEGRPVPRRDDT